jgi:membrane protease YdiL (CAAX protease family)
MAHRAEHLVTLAALAFLAAAAALPPGSQVRARVVVAFLCLGLAVLARLRLWAGGGSVPLVAALLVLLAAAGLPWPAVALLAVAAVAVLSRHSAAWRIPGGWALGRPRWLEVAAGSAVAPLGLLAWVRLARPDLGDLARLVPALPLPLLVLGGAVFALANAIGEELIWRGVFQTRLEGMLSPGLAMTLQGLSFGAQHAHGFPRGLLGVVLAAAWGIQLGWMRRRSGGVLSPVLTHVVADATIAAIVLSMATGPP